MQSSLNGVLPQNSETAAKTSCMLPLAGGDFEALVVEEFAFGIFGFSHAVGDQDQAVPGVQAVAVAFVHRVRQQADGQTSVRGADDLAAADQQRRNVAAVYVFEFAVAAQAGDDHGRVFFTDALAGEEAIGGIDNLRQRHARDELRIDHALQSRGEQRR